MTDLVGPILEGLLAVLLIAALMYGMRLERKLRALRDTQAGFAEAVRSLDVAAARAEQGLETLRRTAEETHDGLHDRITKARVLTAEMERLITRAERASEDLAKAQTEAAAAAPQPLISSVTPVRAVTAAQVAETRRNARVTFTATAEEAPLDLTELAEVQPTRPMRDMPRPASQPAATSKRSVARGVDEDLFESSSAGADRPRRSFGVRR